MPLDEFAPLVAELMRRPRDDASDTVVSWAVAGEQGSDSRPTNASAASSVVGPG